MTYTLGAGKAADVAEEGHYAVSHTIAERWLELRRGD
jgi:hypothetical protein